MYGLDFGSMKKGDSVGAQKTTVVDYSMVATLGVVHVVEEKDTWFTGATKIETKIQKPVMNSSNGATYTSTTSFYRLEKWLDVERGVEVMNPLRKRNERRRLNRYSGKALDKLEMLAADYKDEYMLDLLEEVRNAESRIRSDERYRTMSKVEESLDELIEKSKKKLRRRDTDELDQLYFHGGRLTGLYDAEELLERRSY